MAKRARMKFPAPLAEILDEGLKGLGIAGRLREASIWAIWPEVVGKTIASRAQPVRIIDGSLTVAVSSGPWMQELNFLKGMMLQKLNARLGGDVVREIVLRSGRVPAPSVSDEEAPRVPKQLNAEQQAWVMKEAEALKDEETRTAFIELMKASLTTGR